MRQLAPTVRMLVFITCSSRSNGRPDAFAIESEKAFHLQAIRRRPMTRHLQGAQHPCGTVSSTVSRHYNGDDDNADGCDGAATHTSHSIQSIPMERLALMFKHQLPVFVTEKQLLPILTPEHQMQELLPREGRSGNFGRTQTLVCLRDRLGVVDKESMNTESGANGPIGVRNLRLSFDRTAEDDDHARQCVPLHAAICEASWRPAAMDVSHTASSRSLPQSDDSRPLLRSGHRCRLDGSYTNTSALFDLHAPSRIWMH